MKKYNQDIQITVSVDAIAENLLSSIVDTNPHRVTMVEAIIDTALSSNNLSSLYNAMSGFVITVGYKEQDKVTHKGNDRVVKSIDTTRPDGCYVLLHDKYGDEKGWVNHAELTPRA